MVRRAGIVVLFGAALLAACQVIAGIERVDKVQPSAIGPGSSSSSGGSPDAAADPCKHVLPPDPPAQSDKGGDESSRFYLATKTLSLTKPPANGVTGFDLDGVCTCDPRNGTAFDGGSSCTPSGTSLCDMDGGIDNQGQQLFMQVQTSAGIDLDQQFENGINDGSRTIMLYVEGWNGLANDLDVQIGIFISNGTLPPDDGGVHNPPNWDGNDTWSYPTAAHQDNGFVVPASTAAGYVTNNRLVVQKAGKVTILFGNSGLGFGDAIIVGDLAKDKTTNLVSFTGVIGGRIPQTDLLELAGQLKIGGSSTPVCEGATAVLFNGVIVPAICQSSDIGVTALTDFKNGKCNAISSDITIFAQSAMIGGASAVDPTGDVNPCAPGQPGAPAYTCP